MVCLCSAKNLARQSMMKLYLAIIQSAFAINRRALVSERGSASIFLVLMAANIPWCPGS